MIKKLAIPLSLAAAATLAACAGVPQHEGTVVVGSAESSYVAAVGTVTSATLAAVRPGAGKVTELTDGQGPVADLSNQRVTLKMKDGSAQGLFVRGEQLTLGEDIAIRSDNTIRREPRN